MHMKTVLYRPQDQFLLEFAYAIRTAVNETTGKTPAELFLGRKLITPFQKLVLVSDGTEFAHNLERKSEQRKHSCQVPVGTISDQEEEQKWSPEQPKRRRHNKEDQFEEAETISTAPTLKSKQGQAAGIPEADGVNNRIARRGKEERTVTDPSPFRS
ncbi:hypothetical protein TNCV_1857471 [Trichonephila clavipes]|nr:hypothetical protein TNCV_1857471 [Trichonephila clavipes]